MSRSIGRLRTGKTMSGSIVTGSFAALPFPESRRWRLFVEVTYRPVIGALTSDIIHTLMVQRARGITALLQEPTWLSEFREPSMIPSTA
jgi:hypothetical protein